MRPAPGRRVPLLNLGALHAGIRDELMAAIRGVFEKQRFILGEEVRELERALAGYCGVRHAIGCASGSDALYLALLAAGIGPGDKVVTPPFTFFATAGAISRVGALPVFVDIDPDTFHISPELLARTLESVDRIRAVIPVDLFGGCADMDPILETARRHGCFVIEDGAQAIGAQYKGRRALGLADVGCLSFFPTKNLGGLGDGGMLMSDDGALADKLLALRTHGGVRKYHHPWIGINSRLDTLQAACLLVKLRYLDEWTARRQSHAALYQRLLAAERVPVTAPKAASHQTRHVWNQFVVRCPERDRLRKHLEERGIGTEIYYPLPLHLQPCYAPLGHRAGDFPASEQAAGEVLALPVDPPLEVEDIEYVCGAIRAFFG